MPQLVTKKWRRKDPGQTSPSIEPTGSTQPIKEKKKQQSSEHMGRNGDASKPPKFRTITYSTIWTALLNDFDQKTPRYGINLLHSLLYILPAYHATFQKLLARCFQEPINERTIVERIAEREKGAIANEVALFLQQHGGFLWPLYLPRLAHLCSDPVRERLGRCWPGGKGPTLVLHGKMTTVDTKKRWR